MLGPLGEGILSPSPSTEPREWCASSRTPFARLGPLAHLPLVSCAPAPVTLCPRTRPGYRLAGALSPAGGPFCLSARLLRGPSHPGLQLTALKPCPHPLPGHRSCTEARRRQSLARGKRRAQGAFWRSALSQGSRRSKEVGASQKCCKTLTIRWPANAFLSKKQRVLGFHGTGAGLELALSHLGGRRSSRPTSIKYQPPEINGLLLVPWGWAMSSREAENKHLA